MAINITRWSPDTCGCIVEYSWDDSLPQDSRIHTISNIVSKCSAHSGITGMVAHYNTLMGENPRKNNLLEHLRSSFSILTTTDSEGNVVLKNGTVSWLFDVNRVLQVTIPSLTTAQKTSAQNWADTNLGIGKVKVN